MRTGLESSHQSGTFDRQNPSTWRYPTAELSEANVHYVAPPLWYLLNLIPWTLERSNPLSAPNISYLQGLEDVVDREGDIYKVIDALVRQVGVTGIFTDWPATLTYYESCILP